MGMELENRMISAEWLKSKCYEICDEYNTERLHIDRIIDEIDNAPDVEVVHGHWENITGGMVSLGDCSECKVRQPVIGTNYCKNCGAKMDGVQE